MLKSHLSPRAIFIITSTICLLAYFFLKKQAPLYSNIKILGYTNYSSTVYAKTKVVVTNEAGEKFSCHYQLQSLTNGGWKNLNPPWQEGIVASLSREEYSREGVVHLPVPEGNDPWRLKLYVYARYSFLKRARLKVQEQFHIRLPFDDDRVPVAIVYTQPLGHSSNELIDLSARLAIHTTQTNETSSQVPTGVR